MHELITTVLEALFLLLVLAGVVSILLPYIGWDSLAVAGVLGLVATRISLYLNEGGSE
jgi:hypothetical protein